MADLIDRQAAIDTVRSYYDECDEREESIEERIEQLPSADAIEVVRCKDCTLSEEDVGGWWCIACEIPTEKDGYCSRGERKDG